MPGIDLATAEAQLALWIAADTAVASNQSYTIGGRTWTRADAKTIAERITFWDRKVKELSKPDGDKIRVRGGLADI